MHAYKQLVNGDYVVLNLKCYHFLYNNLCFRLFLVKAGTRPVRLRVWGLPWHQMPFCPANFPWFT